MSMEDRISLNIDEGVAHATLIRADKMNALDGRMFSAFVEVGQLLRSDSSVRAVVLSAEGKAFCAGLDTSNFMQMAAGATERPKMAGLLLLALMAEAQQRP